MASAFGPLAKLASQRNSKEQRIAGHPVDELAVATTPSDRSAYADFSLIEPTTRNRRIPCLGSRSHLPSVAKTREPPVKVALVVESCIADELFIPVLVCPLWPGPTGRKREPPAFAARLTK